MMLDHLIPAMFENVMIFYKSYMKSIKSSWLKYFTILLQNSFCHNLWGKVALSSHCVQLIKDKNTNFTFTKRHVILLVKTFTKKLKKSTR